VKLVPGSALYYNLYFLDRFRREGGKKFTSEEEKMYQQFQTKYYNTTEFKQIWARYSFLQYDQATEEGER
jgi:hypothetical protein